MAEIKDKVVTVESLSTLHEHNKNYYMTKDNPTGVGAFSLNRADNTEIGNYSFAEGNVATASGMCSHAEGQSTTASGIYSHAEGGGTTASSEASHAEGYSTIASGKFSHAEGSLTKASGRCQHVQGMNNIEDSENKYLHIVGNGDTSTPSNAHTIDWDGNAWFAGSISADGNMILSSNQYGDELPEAGNVGRIFFKRLTE